MEKLRDLKISGISKLNGGKFDFVEISGIGTIFGEVEANRINISGNGTIQGDIKAGHVDVDGNGHAEGSIEAGNMKISGNFRIDGNVKAENLKSDGRCRIDGSVKSDEILCDGLLKVRGGVEAEKFQAKGSFKIGGLLNANQVEIRLSMASYAKEIGGEEIIVKKMKSFGFEFALLLVGKAPKLITDLIEGTDITLEYTEAAAVRGNNIKIGPHCIIDSVEYTGSLEVDEGSVVRNRKKI